MVLKCIENMLISRDLHCCNFQWSAAQYSAKAGDGMSVERGADSSRLINHGEPVF